MIWPKAELPLGLNANKFDVDKLCDQDGVIVKANFNSNNQIILASSSPQRKDLLLQIGINPSKIVHPNLDENKHKDIFPSKLVQELAVKKALIVLKKFGNNKFFIISGDTIVCRSRKIFKKTIYQFIWYIVQRLAR